jgi:bacterioferritin
MQELDHKKTIDLLNAIMEFELAGVVRYTHYSLMVTGPNRIPIVGFSKRRLASLYFMLNKWEKYSQV